jgi:integrase
MPVTVLGSQAAGLAGRSWGEVVDVFLAAGCDCASTRRVYGWALRRAFAVMGCATLDEVTPYDLAMYREAIMLAPIAPATRRHQIAAVRSFLRWARAFGLHHIGPEIIDVVLRVPPAKTQAPYSILSEEEIARLLSVRMTPRDRALLMVMLGAGLRVAEVSALVVADLVTGEPSYIVVKQGKGGHSRAVPVRPEVMQSLWPLATGRRGDTPVFRTNRGPKGRLHEPGIRERLTALATKANINRPISPHTLRHTYATRALLHGNGNVMAISKLLGHRQLSTTQRYLDHLELPDLLAGIPPLPSTGVRD